MFFNKLLILATLFASDWYQKKFEGWYYFQEQSAPIEECPYSGDEAAAILEEDKEKLSEALSLALLAPTKENIKTYAIESKRHIKRSAEFADACSRAFSNNSLLEKLGKSHFLLFCFRGDETDSIKAAETVLQFTEINGWKFKAVSLDGLGTKGIASFETDQGISALLDVKSTPSIYTVDPIANQGSLVGVGALTVAELEQNILSGAGNE